MVCWWLGGRAGVGWRGANSPDKPVRSAGRTSCFIGVGSDCRTSILTGFRDKICGPNHKSKHPQKLPTGEENHLLCVRCRCGINVHLRDGKIRYIEGNRDHPVNRGVLCAKGSAGIMQHYSPARLRSPMKRVGPRGSGQFEEIGWDEAMEIATGWLAPIRISDPKKLAFLPVEISHRP